MKPFPHRYEVSSNWSPGPTGTLTAGPRPNILVGLPPEFDGGDAWWSPEHLLVAAASSCLMETFLTLARRRGVEIKRWRCEAAGELDKASDGFRFTALRFRVDFQSEPGQREAAEKLLETAKRSCMIANSLKAQAELEIVAARDGARS